MRVRVYENTYTRSCTLYLSLLPPPQLFCSLKLVPNLVGEHVDGADIVGANSTVVEGAVVPVATHDNALVQRKEPADGTGGDGCNREQAAGDVAHQVGVPRHGRVEVVVVTGREVKNAVVQPVPGLRLRQLLPYTRANE